MEIFPGEKVLIVGPSGSGKSTIGSCLNGILPHLHKGEASGELSIAGLPFGTSIAELSEKVSTILQDTDGQFIGLSVAEDIAFALENDGLIHDELVSKVAYWSDKTETNKLLNHHPQDLLFDEPLANLDPQTCLETMALIKDIHENNEVTTIIIEHRIEEVLPLGIDKIVVVNDGEIVAIGSPAELLKTEIFNENSLREPLYLSALKAANATKLLTDFSDLKSFEVLSAKKLLTDFLDTYKFTDKAVSKNNILSVKNLSVNFAQHEVLKGINLENFNCREKWSW